MVMLDDLYDNSDGGDISVARYILLIKEKSMDTLQKIIIFVTVAFVVGGLGWFIFLAH